MLVVDKYMWPNIQELKYVEGKYNFKIHRLNFGASKTKN